MLRSGLVWVAYILLLHIVALWALCLTLFGWWLGCLDVDLCIVKNLTVNPCLTLLIVLEVLIVAGCYLYRLWLGLLGWISL